jgi:hypothetical protein
VEQAGADLQRAEAALRRLEAGLVGTPLLPKAGGTGNVRPFAAPQAEAVAG